MNSSPRPTPPPGVRPRPPRPSDLAAARPAPEPASPPSPAAPAESDAASWGRVDDEGTVYVRTADGEKVVGQWPGGDPAEVLAHFARKYDALAFELDLLEQRVQSGVAAPEDARKALGLLRESVADAQAVGDLAALDAQLGRIQESLEQAQQRRKEERARRVAEAATRKTEIAEEAERLAESNDWRAGADRMRALLEEWKSLPRLDKQADDTLWRRFSGARTTYTRRRKAHFAELDEKREGARAVKEKLVKEAEALADSTDWGPTSTAYRELMRRWKAAGPAPRGVDDELWKRFRAAQDSFFGARDAANAARDAEFAGNAEVKEKLLVEAEALVPVTDLAAAKAAFRDLADRWDAAGKVPRDRVKSLEGRMRAVERAIRESEEAAWRRSNPEARARAADTVAQLEASLAELEKARAAAEAAGNDRKAADHAAAIEARSAWLVEARKALDEFAD